MSDAVSHRPVPATPFPGQGSEPPHGISGPRATEPFISYSANGEDVLLHRLFGARDGGRFVDVGAAHPRDENDTYALYLAGWRGVNVEPNPGFHAELVSLRPEDTNLAIALSDAEGEEVWHEVVGTGLSTLSAALAEQHRAHGHETRPRRVRTSTLARVLEDAGIGPRFELLKVDVEGLEEEVLRGNDWDRFRPEVVMLEATLPESRQRRETGIHDFLTGHGYRRAYFDGLNDFYLEAGFDPGDAFDAPVNVFDNVVSRELHDARLVLEQERARAAGLETEVANAVTGMRSAEAHFEKAQTYARSLQDHLIAAGEHTRSLQDQLVAASEHDRSLQDQLTAASERARSLEGQIGDARDRGRAWKDEADANLALSLRLLGREYVSTIELAAHGARGTRYNQDPHSMNDTAPAQPSVRDDPDIPSPDRTAIALVSARAATAEAEIRSLRHDIDGLQQRNKRLHDAAGQMRAEIVSLSRLLDTAPATASDAALMAEHGGLRRARDDLQHEHDGLRRERDDLQRECDGLRDDLDEARRRTIELEGWLAAVASSTSWKLVAPYRVVGRRIKKLLGR